MGVVEDACVFESLGFCASLSDFESCFQEGLRNERMMMMMMLIPGALF